MNKRMIRIIALCFVLVLLVSCIEKKQPLNQLHIHTSVNEAGELWVNVNNSEPIRLLHHAQGYRPLVSPDGKWLAVEVRLMSDLEIVHLFRRDGNRFVAADQDVTTVAWRLVMAANNIELEALTHTKARVSGWSNDGASLSLVLSAFEPNEQDWIKTVVSIPLEHNRNG